MTKILITGANGQLGSELRNLLDERGGLHMTPLILTKWISLIKPL